ncbi:MAG: type II toxin-antitoxin system prevent-host-death family antitoxin [Actinomycetota bacterium]
METVSVSEAKATLSRLVQRALAGESIIIGRRGQPEVVLQAYSPDQEPRQLGFVSAADYWMSDDFDDPMPELIELFQGESPQ